MGTVDNYYYSIMSIRIIEMGTMTFENRNNEYCLLELLPYFWNSL
jgi:hypothetical protein